MGTTVFERHGIKVTRFYGGKERGQCFQINLASGYVQLTKQEYQRLVLDLLDTLKI